MCTEIRSLALTSCNYLIFWTHNSEDKVRDQTRDANTPHYSENDLLLRDWFTVLLLVSAVVLNRSLVRPILGILEVGIHVALGISDSAFFVRLELVDSLHVIVRRSQTGEERNRPISHKSSSNTVRFFRIRGRGPSLGFGVEGWQSTFRGCFGFSKGSEGIDQRKSRQKVNKEFHHLSQVNGGNHNLLYYWIVLYRFQVGVQFKIVYQRKKDVVVRITVLKKDSSFWSMTTIYNYEL